VELGSLARRSGSTDRVASRFQSFEIHDLEMADLPFCGWRPSVTRPNDYLTALAL